MNAARNCPVCSAAPQIGEHFETGVSIACRNPACKVRPRVDQKVNYAADPDFTEDELFAVWNRLDAETAKARSDVFALWLDRVVAEIRAAYESLPDDKKRLFRETWQKWTEEQRKSMEVQDEKA